MGLRKDILGDAKTALKKMRSNESITLAEFQKILQKSDIDYCRRAYELLYVLDYIDLINSETSYYLKAKVNSEGSRKKSLWLLAYLPCMFYGGKAFEEGLERLLKESTDDDSGLLLTRTMNVIYYLAEKKTKYFIENGCVALRIT